MPVIDLRNAQVELSQPLRIVLFSEVFAVQHYGVDKTVHQVPLTRSGDLADDFLIEEHGRVLNVCNAPSPAATASLNIGRLIVDKLQPRLSK